MRRRRRPGGGGGRGHGRGRVRRFLTALLILIVPGVVAAWLLTGDRSSSAPPAAAIHDPVFPSAGKPGDRNARPSGRAAPPGISLFGSKPIKLRFHNQPRAGLVFDVDTGQVLWAHRPLRRLPIASLTKIMTAIITVERTRPGERARVTREALNYEGSGVGVLPRGKLVPVEGLLAGLLLPSGNDAALTLADHLEGTDRRFARVMNRRARAMGLGCTHYVSSHGLQDGNRSCAADLAALAREAMSKPRIARIVRRPQAKVRFPIKTGFLYVNTTNPLLHLGYPGTIGLKTGSTDKAGHCFVGVVRRGKRTLGVVLLHSPNSGAQAVKLMNAAFKLRP
jgi:D-alanyl-D-alanine carboxypeptidase